MSGSKPKPERRSWCYLCGTSHPEQCPLTPEQREARSLARIALRPMAAQIARKPRS